MERQLREYSRMHQCENLCADGPVRWESITIGFAAISILFTAYEIFRTFAEALTPKEMVVSSIIKLVGIIVSMIMGGLMSDTEDLSKWITGTQAIHGVLM